MFDIGLSELMLVFMIGLVIFGPERLPIAVRTVVSWIGRIKAVYSTMQNELIKEINVQEQQDNLRKMEKIRKKNLSSDFENLDAGAE